MKFKYGDYFFYKLVCLSHDVDLSYVGSTTNWCVRRNSHKSKCNNPTDKEYNTKKYQLIRENGGMSNFKMVQIGFTEHLTKREAEAVEEDYRVEIRANMNGQRCSGQYYQEHRQERVEYDAKYYRDHRQEKAEYRQVHKQEKAEYDSKYRQDNHQKINEKFGCEVCGGRYTRSNKSYHMKSIRHKQAVGNTPSTSTE
jgi:hypothetical protein